MVVQEKKRITVAEFDAWVMQPENADRDFEYINGEIVEVVSNNYSSKVGMLLGARITVFAEQNQLGDVTGADGGYMVSGERYIPDAAFISRKRQPAPSHAAYNPNAPDLAVEVLSPSNTPAQMRIKIINYLRAGTTVWLADTDIPQIEVYAPGQAPKVYGIEDVLDGGDVLPGFKLPVKDIFPTEPTTTPNE